MPRTARALARHRLATLLGVPAGSGSTCACCGESPFDSAGSFARVMGSGFADVDCLERGQVDAVCLGCQRLLAGKPGRVPPPLRMRSLLVADGVVTQLDTAAEMWRVLVDPPATIELLSWAGSKQKHHVLRAELSTREHLRIGADDATISYRPDDDADLLEAIVMLRRGCSREEVLSGHYRPSSIRTLGVARWAQTDAVVAPRRGEALTRLLVAHAPSDRETAPPAPLETPVLSDTDQQAVHLLSSLAHASGLRLTDGLRFWGSLFERRIIRHMARDLPEFVSRLMRDLDVVPTSGAAQEVTSFAAAVDPVTARAVMVSIRRSTTLLVALAFDAHKRASSARRAGRTPASSTPVPPEAQSGLFTDPKESV